MGAVNIQVAAGDHEELWVSTLAAEDDPSLQRARALAHAALVEASMKVADIRAAAHSALLDARIASEEMLFSARQQAEEIRQAANVEAARERERLLAAARLNAGAITDRALDQRDVLLTATLDRIAELSTSLVGMADQIVAHAEDPGIARAQLAQFMLSLTDMAEQINQPDLQRGGSSDPLDELADVVSSVEP